MSAFLFSLTFVCSLFANSAFAEPVAEEIAHIRPSEVAPGGECRDQFTPVPFEQWSPEAKALAYALRDMTKSFESSQEPSISNNVRLRRIHSLKVFAGTIGLWLISGQAAHTPEGGVVLREYLRDFPVVFPSIILGTSAVIGVGRLTLLRIRDWRERRRFRRNLTRLETAFDRFLDARSSEYPELVLQAEIMMENCSDPSRVCDVPRLP